jgi:hypothetical protein
MQKLYAFASFLLITSATFGQSNPTPFNLASGIYTFSAWPASSAAGTYPPNMAFHFTNDPTGSSYDRTAPGTADFNCAYNITARPRFVGRDANGVSIVTTGSAQYDNCASGSAASTRFTGAIVLALNTTGRESIRVTWIAGSLSVGDGTPPRLFSLQLQYRIGTSGNFTDVPGGGYASGAVGSAQNFDVILPAPVNNQPVVQLRWVSYQTSTTGTGTRPELRLDEINVLSTVLPVTYFDITARYTPQKTMSVNWATAAERNNARFEVERSLDLDTYLTLGSVAGKGTTSGRQQYSFTDEAPAPGWNYYRLRQIDTDGTASTSRPIAVLNENGLDGEILLFPNPANAEVQLQLPQGEAIEQITAIGAAGQRVLMSITDKNRLNVSQLPVATYLIEVQTSAGRVLRKRLLKE